jgi:hypothetical protein
MNLGFSKDQIAALLRRLDSGQHGYVSYREFLEQTAEACRSLQPQDFRLQRDIDSALDEVSDGRLFHAVAEALHRRGMRVDHIGLGNGNVQKREVVTALKALNLGVPHSDLERLVHHVSAERSDGLVSIPALAHRLRGALDAS